MVLFSLVVSLSLENSINTKRALISEEKVSSLYGIISSEPNGRDDRSYYYTLDSIYAFDENGSLFTYEKHVPVISKLPGVNKGTLVEIKGFFYNKNRIFVTEDTSVIKNSPTSRPRSFLLSKIRKSFGYNEAGLLSSLLLTGSANKSPEILTKGRQTGLSFLFALSGLHLSLIYTIFSPPFLNKKKKAFFNYFSYTLMFLITYLSGWRISLFRSLIFLFLTKKIDKNLSFALSYLAILKIFPYSFLDLASSFSFVSLSGLIIFSPYLEKIFYNLPIPLKVNKGISSSIGALVTSSPLSYLYFSYFQVFSVVSSFFLSPLVYIYLTLSIFTLFFPCLDLIKTNFYKLLDISFYYFSLIPTQKSGTLLVVLVLSTLFLLLLVLVFENRKYFFKKYKKVKKYFFFYLESKKQC